MVWGKFRKWNIGFASFLINIALKFDYVFLLRYCSFSDCILIFFISNTTCVPLDKALDVYIRLWTYSITTPLERSLDRAK